MEITVKLSGMKVADFGKLVEQFGDSISCDGVFCNACPMGIEIKNGKNLCQTIIEHKEEIGKKAMKLAKSNKSKY